MTDNKSEEPPQTFGTSTTTSYPLQANELLKSTENTEQVNKNPIDGGFIIVFAT